LDAEACYWRWLPPLLPIAGCSALMLMTCCRLYPGFLAESIKADTPHHRHVFLFCCRLAAVVAFVAVVVAVVAVADVE